MFSTSCVPLLMDFAPVCPFFPKGTSYLVLVRVVIIYLVFATSVVESKDQYVEPLNMGMKVSINYDIANLFNRHPVQGALSVFLALAIGAILFFGVITSPFGYMFGIPSEKYVLGDVTPFTDPSYIDFGGGFDPSLGPPTPGITTSRDGGSSETVGPEVMMNDYPKNPNRMQHFGDSSGINAGSASTVGTIRDPSSPGDGWKFKKENFDKRPDFPYAFYRNNVPTTSPGPVYVHNLAKLDTSQSILSNNNNDNIPSALASPQIRRMPVNGFPRGFIPSKMTNDILKSIEDNPLFQNLIRTGKNLFKTLSSQKHSKDCSEVIKRVLLKLGIKEEKVHFWSKNLFSIIGTNEEDFCSKQLEAYSKKLGHILNIFGELAMPQKGQEDKNNSAETKEQSPRSSNKGIMDILWKGLMKVYQGTNFSPDFKQSLFYLMPSSGPLRTPGCELLAVCQAHGALRRLPISVFNVYRFFSQKFKRMPKKYRRAMVQGLKDESKCSEVYYDACPDENIFTITLKSYVNLLPKSATSSEVPKRKQAMYL